MRAKLGLSVCAVLLACGQAATDGPDPEAGTSAGPTEGSPAGSTSESTPGADDADPSQGSNSPPGSDADSDSDAESSTGQPDPTGGPSSETDGTDTDTSGPSDSSGEGPTSGPGVLPGETGLDAFCRRYLECGGTYYGDFDACMDASLGYWGECVSRRTALDEFGACMSEIACEDYNPDAYNPAATVCSEAWGDLQASDPC